MKKLLSITGALTALALVTTAQAADLPRAVYKAPPAAAPVAYTWTGFYFGGNVGYGIGRDPTTETTVSGSGYPTLGSGFPLYSDLGSYNVSPNGINGGVQAGYNMQVAPMWVLGIETDFQFTGMKDSANCILTCNNNGLIPYYTPTLALYPVDFPNFSYSQKINWFGTVRGRVGYASGPALFYFTGGLAYARIHRTGSVVGETYGIREDEYVNNFAGSFDNSSTKTGWTIGGGIEAKLWGAWSAKAEYLYMDLGTISDVFSTFYTQSNRSIYGTVGSTAATRTISSDLREHIFRVGLNYQFNGQH